jgi:acyl carrier protein
MYDKAIALVCDATGYDKFEVSSEDDLQSLELWDSIAHVNIMLALEKQLNRSLTTPEIINVTSIAGIQKLLDKVQVTT